MGRYIPGPPRKLETLKSHGAVPIPQPTSLTEVPADKALVVLAEGGLFDAVAWAYDELEFREFTDPGDPRRRSYWLLNLDLAKRLTGTT